MWFLTNVIKQVKRSRKGKTVKKCGQISFDTWLLIFFGSWNVFLVARYNSPAALGIVTAHLNNMLSNFFNLPEGYFCCKALHRGNSIFLMVRWLCHLSWCSRLFSINICVRIKSCLSWKHNDSPVKKCCL